MLLMPETGFKRMYVKFKRESNNHELDTIIKLMAYYQVPYMSVLIRCYELGLPENNSISEQLLSIEKSQIRKKLGELWLDDTIMDASAKDDYKNIELFVKKTGNKYIQDGYINERTLNKVLQNMQQLYKKIKGE